MSTVQEPTLAIIVTPVAATEVLRSRGREELVLQACHPRFFASHRYLVYASPVRVTPRGGSPLTVTEDELLRANYLARNHTHIDVDHTGSAGLAGLLHLQANRSAAGSGEIAAVLFTGVRRP